MTETILTAPRRRKRSSHLALTTAMAAAGLSLTACDQPWDASAAQQKPVEAVAYANLDECKTADAVPDAECDKAFEAARADDEKRAPRYAAVGDCEAAYGAGNCVPRGYNNGGSGWFTPMLTGFVIGRMLDGGGRPYYNGTGLYRDNNGYVTSYGGRLNRDYYSGRTVVARDGIDLNAPRAAPTKVQSRTAAISRGGFGGRSSGYHFGG